MSFIPTSVSPSVYSASPLLAARASADAGPVEPSQAPAAAAPGFDDKVRALQANQQVYETLQEVAGDGAHESNGEQQHPEAGRHPSAHANAHASAAPSKHATPHKAAPSKKKAPTYANPAERTAHTVAKPKSAFVATVQQNFVKWDTNKDGSLDANEIDKAMADPTNKGNAAAALGALEDQETNHNEFTFGAKDLRAVEKEKGASAYDDNMRWGKDNIDSYNKRTSLFGKSGQPSINDIDQGRLGDCYFLASVASKVQRDPQAIKDMIHQNDDGTYSVAFSNGTVTVDAPTEAEASRSAQTQSQGRWVEVMEKAFGAYRQKQKGEGADPDPYEAIDQGGWMTTVYDELGSKSTATYALQDATSQGFSVLQDAGGSIKSYLDDGKLLTASTGNKTLNGLPTNHAYTIEGYDPATQIITIRNPWGSIGVADTKSAGLTDLGSGQFAMNINDFTKNFDFVAVG